jgi:hypothetical protein
MTYLLIALLHNTERCVIQSIDWLLYYADANFAFAFWFPCWAYDLLSAYRLATLQAALVSTKQTLDPFYVCFLYYKLSLVISAFWLEVYYLWLHNDNQLICFYRVTLQISTLVMLHVPCKFQHWWCYMYRANFNIGDVTVGWLYTRY